MEANPARIDQYIEKYHMILEKKNSKSTEVATLKLDIERDKIKLIRAKNILSTLKGKEELYEQNKQANHAQGIGWHDDWPASP